jgi:uncharacterized protein YggU (UPF0235/DUF167 family)
MVRISVRVTPGAREDVVSGWRDGTLLVRVRAAPEHSKANDAVCRLLARALGVPGSHVRIARGATSRQKLLDIEGLDEEAILRKLSGPSR